jgi:hypothetical protein
MKNSRNDTAMSLVRNVTALSIHQLNLMHFAGREKRLGRESNE